MAALLRRDRWVVGSGLALVTVLAWADLVQMAAAPGMASMGEMIDAAGIHPWSAGDFALMFWMWAVMMVAMMLPSAGPMILLYARMVRTNRQKGNVLAPTAVFASGYAAAWTTFSAGATSLQWALDQAALLSPAMVATSPSLGAAILILAGAYQWTPWKDACLRHCRSPAHFLSTHWRRGTLGAFRMGVDHGAYCVGCCWALMALLFVGGVMSFLWIAAIAFFVLIEKIAPLGARAGRLSGAALVAAGVASLIVRAWPAAP